MGDCTGAGTWNHTGPSTSGFYEVRPCPEEWDFGPESPYIVPSPRITYVDVATGRFDARKFGGDIDEPCWEWRGPIAVPSAL